MTRGLQAAWNEFLYGGHLQCLGSVAILAAASDVLQAPFPWGLPVATYAVSYAVYVYNRLLEIPADAITNPERTAYIVSHKRALWQAFFVAAVLGAAVVMLTAALPGAIFLAMIFGFGLLYTNIFKAITRYIPGFKALYVSAAFAALVILPFLYAGEEIPAATWPFAGWALGNGLIMQIFLDLKDMPADESARLRTLPLLLGRKRTFQLLIGLTFLAVVPPLVWGIRGSYPQYTAALALAPLFSLGAFRSAARFDYLGYLLESGKFIIWPVLLALGRLVT